VIRIVTEEGFVVLVDPLRIAWINVSKRWVQMDPNGCFNLTQESLATLMSWAGTSLAEKAQ